MQGFRFDRPTPAELSKALSEIEAIVDSNDWRTEANFSACSQVGIGRMPRRASQLFVTDRENRRAGAVKLARLQSTAAEGRAVPRTG